MSKVMNYGLIGCGMMAQEHVRNIALLPDAAVAVVTRVRTSSRPRSCGSRSDSWRRAERVGSVRVCARSCASSAGDRGSDAAPQEE